MCMISCFTWLGSMTPIIIHNSIEQHVQFVHNATWLMPDNDYGNYVLRMDKTCYWHAYFYRVFSFI